MRVQTKFHDGWTARRKANRFLEMRGGAAPPVPVTLPHDALIGESRDPAASHTTAYFPDGVWEYSVTLHAPQEWRERRVSLFFEGVYRDALVYVNDDLAATHAYGYTEFQVRLDPFLNFGEDNTIRVEARTYDDARWYSGAGIHRPVHLVVTEAVHVALDGVTITTPEVDDAGALVAVATLVDNETAHTRTVRVAHHVIAPDGTVVATGSAPLTLRPGTSAACRQRLYLPGALRWGADHPHLYTCSTTLTDIADAATVLDAVSDRFGVRTLCADPVHGLRINGETVKLRGACIHHDNGPLGAATIDRAEERRVEILKAAGFNAIRAAHNPLSRAMLDACDRVGMLVMDEAFDVWTEGKRDHDHSLRFLHTWRDDLAAMVRKDKNRPSVILYSTGNEIPEVGSAHGAALARDIAEHTRALDPTRLVTNAVQPLLSIRNLIPDLLGKASEQLKAAEASVENAEDMGVNSMMIAWVKIKKLILKDPTVGERIEEVCSSLDIAGYNYLDERYLADGELYPHRVIVGSETYAKEIGRNWPLIESQPYLVGDFTWTGWDYLGEVGIGRTDYVDPEKAEEASYMGNYPWLTAATGDIDICGVRLPQSYYREVVFGLRREPYIAVQRPEHHGKQVEFSGPWSWTDALASWTWAAPAGSPVKIDVYSSSDEVELVLNGRSLGRKPTGVANDYRTVFEATYEPGELVAVGYTAGAETSRQLLATAIGEVVLMAAADSDAISADTADLAYVAITFTDAAGNLNNPADRRVAVQVDGPGVLQGLASGNPRSLDNFTGGSCATFDGRALAVVRPTGAGSITVTVTAEGCAPALVAIEAMEVVS